MGEVDRIPCKGLVERCTFKGVGQGRAQKAPNPANPEVGKAMWRGGGKYLKRRLPHNPCAALGSGLWGGMGYEGVGIMHCLGQGLRRRDDAPNSQ